MTDPNQGRKKKKITYVASPQGLRKAENTLIRLGISSKINFAKSQRLARSTVTKFFQCQPIQLDSFERICNALTLDWKEIAGISEEKQSGWLARKDCSNSNTNEGVEQVQTLRRQVTIIDRDSKRVKAVIVLQGDINSVQNFNLLHLVLQENSGDTIEITDIKEGSIKLFLGGSQEDVERLRFRIKLGEIKEISGFPVEDIQILSDSLDDDESIKLDDKWHLVQEIVSQRAEGRNLRGADISDADLGNVYLCNADLSGADLSGADLSGANLSGANLSGADLSGADLRWDADLSGADLSGADLSGANLSGANLSDANLSDANLARAFLTCADLSHANLINANLSNACLSRPKLNSANLSNANLSNAFLRGGSLRSAKLFNVNLSGADLRGANLINADLSGADLSGANLSGANLSGANLLAAKDVKGARLGSGLGLTESEKVVLKRRGAIFDDFSGDRELVYSPVSC